MQHYFTLQCLLAAQLYGVTLCIGLVGAPIEARSQSTDGVCCDPDAGWFAGPALCFAVQGGIDPLDGVICDWDCGVVDECQCPGLIDEGCVDEEAANFDANATCDDGSCVYSDCCETGLTWSQELSDATVECVEDLPMTCEDFAANLYAVNACNGETYEAVCIPLFSLRSSSDASCSESACFDYTALDFDCGRALTERFCVNREDTTPPVIFDGPADATVECDAVPEIAGTDAIVATDNCSGDLTYAEGFETLVAGEGPCDYQLVRQWTVTDACGLTSTWTQNIAVQNTNPVSNPGCTDGAACNYNPNANQDNGTCEYCSCGALQGVHLRIDPVAEFNLAGQALTSYQARIVGLEPGDVVTSVFGYDEWPMHFNAPEGVFNSPLNPSWHPLFLTDVLLEIAPELQHDTYGTVGLDGPPGSPPTLVEDPAQPFSSFFNSDTASHLTINTAVGGGWYLPPDDPAALSGFGGERLLMQWTTAGTFDGRMNIQWLDDSEGAEEVRSAFVFDSHGRWASLGEEQELICPCTDFNVSLILEDDSLECIPTYSENISYGEYTIEACESLSLELSWTDSIESVDQNGLPLQVLRSLTVADDAGVVAQATQQLAFKPSLPTPWSPAIEINGCPNAQLNQLSPPPGWDIETIEVDTALWECLQVELSRSWTLQDGCETMWTDSQTIHALQDPFASVMGSLSDSSLYCGTALPQEPLVDLVSTSTCTGEELSVLGYTYEEEPEGGFPSITFRYVAFSVECGILEEHFQTFSTIDTIAPSIFINLPEYVEVETFDDNLWPELEVVLVDDCDSLPVWSLSTDTIVGTCPSLLDVHRHILAQDAYGNQSSQTQVISVIDTVPPQINVADDLTLECPADVPSIEGLFNVDDLSPVSLILTTDTLMGICAGNYDVIQSVTALDACNQSSSAARTVTVRDTQSPIVTTIDLEMSCEAYDADFNYASPEITDCSEISGVVWADFELAAPIGGACKTIARNFEALDQCGNLGSAIQLLQLIDTIPPSFSGSLSQLDATCGDLVAGVFASDNCNGWSIQTTVVTSPPPLGLTQFRHHEATDQCGNSATFVQFVTLTDAIDGACDPCNAEVSCEDCSSACGPNTFWDEIAGQCLPLSLQTSCSFDTDGNGLVGTPDLLNFLSAFGDECE